MEPGKAHRLRAQHTPHLRPRREVVDLPLPAAPRAALIAAAADRRLDDRRPPEHDLGMTLVRAIFGTFSTLMIVSNSVTCRPRVAAPQPARRPTIAIYRAHASIASHLRAYLRMTLLVDDQHGVLDEGARGS